jgi:mannose-binding lectin 2
MLGDGRTFYENGNDGRDTMLAGCQADFREKSFPTMARLSYYKDNYMELQVQYEQEGKWSDCFKVLDVKLPDRFYLGFTAHTGQLNGEIVFDGFYFTVNSFLLSTKIIMILLE